MQIPIRISIKIFRRHFPTFIKHIDYVDNTIDDEMFVANVDKEYSDLGKLTCHSPWNMTCSLYTDYSCLYW